MGTAPLCNLLPTSDSFHGDNCQETPWDLVEAAGVEPAS